MTTTIANSVTVFNVAQTFFVDPGVVKNSATASIAAIGLYFKSKPTRTNNQSGIQAPGVTVYLSLIKPNSDEEIPATDKIVFGATKRLGWDDISTSTDASVETKFTFDYPVLLDTGKSYAILIKYDGDEAFTLWKSVEGQNLVGTTNQTAGPAGKYIGKYFEYSYLASTGVANTSSTAGVSGTWKPLNTTDLKFGVYAARFTPDSFANTVITDPTSNTTTTNVVALRSYILEKKDYEFVKYSPTTSSNQARVFGGEIVYQNNVVRPERVQAVAGSSNVFTTNANFTSIFGNGSDDRYVVFFSGATKNVRKITSVVSNTQITVDIPLTFSNASATFSKVVAGKLDIQSRIAAFGKTESVVALVDSSANSSLRFTNNVIEVITVNAGGTGYSNTDTIVVYGGGLAGANAEVNAVANVSTNSTGGIVSYTLSNMGIGFLNTPSFVVKAANGSNSPGSGANLSFGVGMTLLTEQSNAVLANCELMNVPANSTRIVLVDIENPYGTSYYLKSHYLYYATSDGIADVVVSSGGSEYSNVDVVSFTGGGGTGAYGRIKTDSTGKIVDVYMTAAGSGYTSQPTVVVTTAGGSGASLSAVIGVFRNSVNQGLTSKIVDVFERHSLSYETAPLMLSRSYEVLQPNTTITTVTGRTVNTNSSSVIEMVTTSNNVYAAADILSSEVDVFYEKFSINNTYLGENSGNGLAVSKHVSEMVAFANNRTAEDIRVFVNAYRPANTDFKVFARIHNAKDPEPFVDKDWTLLEIKSNGGKYSTTGNERDLIEYEFGFPAYPNTALTSVGTVTTVLNQSNVVGSNTSFNTNFANNNLVKVYSPLFPNNYVIAVVNSVTNSTHMVLKSNISNNNVVGAGLKIDRIDYNQQAFNYSIGGNVVRYYDSGMGEWDGYNEFAIKIVFLSDNEMVVPKIDYSRGIGVTA